MQTIQKRADFLLAQSAGLKFITHRFILRAYRRAEDHPAGEVARFGFTVTKKMGNAVKRNRIKRRLREAVREAVREAAIALAQPGYDYVLISRHSAFDCEFSELVGDIGFAFSRIHANKSRKTQEN